MVDLVLEHVSVSLVPVVRTALSGDVDPFPSDVDVPLPLLQLSHPHGQEISFSAYVLPSSCEKSGLGEVEGEDGLLAVLEIVGSEAGGALGGDSVRVEGEVNFGGPFADVSVTGPDDGLLEGPVAALQHAVGLWMIGRRLDRRDPPLRQFVVEFPHELRPEIAGDLTWVDTPAGDLLVKELGDPSREVVPTDDDVAKAVGRGHGDQVDGQLGIECRWEGRDRDLFMPPLVASLTDVALL